ncbi:MAG: zinc ribbon domain-containing protein [Thermoplasmata archaeon]
MLFIEKLDVMKKDFWSHRYDDDGVRVGEIVHKSLSQRIHTCPSCGFIADRGYNASLNILRSGWDTALVPAEKAAIPAKATASFEIGSPEL